MHTPPAIAYFGYVFARTGYGTAARAYINALNTATENLSVINLGKLPPPKQKDPVVERYWNHPIPPDFYFWHTEPQELKRLDGSHQLIAITTWETNALPESFPQLLNRAAEVWVPSRYNLEVFRQQLSVPVFHLPHAYQEPAKPRLNRKAFNREMGMDENDFVVLSVGTWQERKNLQAVVEAFLRAFPSDPHAILYIKTSFALTEEKNAREQIAQAIFRANPPDTARAAARIHVFPGLWPPDCLALLPARADCMVSLHRGEGWCYPLFEAACQGIPVIATGYSGPLDYLNPDCHRLVRYTLTSPTVMRTSKFRFSFEPWMQWADPDIEHAAQLMREVYENRALARRQAESCAPALRQRYSLTTIGRLAVQRLESLTVN